MKANDVLLLLLLLIVFLPSNKPSNVEDKFFLHASEGMVATQVFAVRDLKPEPVKPDTKYKCEKCKDTGEITSGDGIHKFPCPDCNVPKDTKCKCAENCGREDCKCQSQGAKGCVDNTKAEEKKHKYVVWVFTQPENCYPCKKWENEVKPELIKLGLKVDSDAHSDVVEMNPSKFPTEWNYYKNLSNGGVPLFVSFKDRVKNDSKVGFVDLNTTLKMLGK